MNTSMRVPIIQRCVYSVERLVCANGVYVSHAIWQPDVRCKSTFVGKAFGLRIKSETPVIPDLTFTRRPKGSQAKLVPHDWVKDGVKLIADKTGLYGFTLTHPDGTQRVLNILAFDPRVADGVASGAQKYFRAMSPEQVTMQLDQAARNARLEDEWLSQSLECDAALSPPYGLVPALLGGHPLSSAGL